MKILQVLLLALVPNLSFPVGVFSRPPVMIFSSRSNLKTTRDELVFVPPSSRSILKTTRGESDCQLTFLACAAAFKGFGAVTTCC